MVVCVQLYHHSIHISRDLPENEADILQQLLQLEDALRQKFSIDKYVDKRSQIWTAEFEKSLLKTTGLLVNRISLVIRSFIVLGYIFSSNSVSEGVVILIFEKKPK